ncbi:hypothetical protein EHF33_08785 [Deinococcus psychrotolerans]|uniref:Lipoprotein n=1 Tax=Deinococcus psychrotolerans TaxID=2489213 RepID=A0A3G8YD47_9DEIO|nr:hypothetical protein [Deinococcus psychrotolerans]AZI42833.1 hypothetical protein EHF33_08785 [Deinococcus psychrotolerans]
MARFLPVSLMALCLLLGGCSPGGVSRIRAQVRDWPGEAGQVMILGGGGAALTSSAIDKVGRFTLPLPGAAAMAPLLRPTLQPNLAAGCTDKVAVSDPAAQFYLLPSISASAAGTALTLVSQTRSNVPGGPLDQRVYIYASTPARVQGDSTCAVAASSTSYALNLKAGWNYAVMRRPTPSSPARLESVGDDGFEGWEVAKGK